jgi:hypothetical protein
VTSPRRALIPALALTLACACGSTRHATSSAAPSASSSATGSASPAQATTAETTTNANVSATATTASAATTTSTPGGVAHIRVPATFTIGSGGALNPPTVSVPAFIAIEVTLTSADGRGHRVDIAGREVTVPANGRASLRLPGLRQGRYEVRVDGRPRGALVIGGEPGP